MAGFVAGNFLNKLVKPIQYHQIDSIPDAVLLDVREEIEHQNGNIPGSLLIPVNQLRNRLHELNKSKAIIIYCAVGIRGYIAARILVQNGFTNVYNLSGGYTTYRYATWKNPHKTKRNSDREISQTINQIYNGDMIQLDACGLSCPGPIKAVYDKMAVLEQGNVLQVQATDPGFKTDIESWCKRTGNTLLLVKKENSIITARIRKGDLGETIDEMIDQSSTEKPDNQDKTIVCFSGDLDKAIAALTIANGAVAMGRKVTLFFTFWGINIVRKNSNVRVKKDFISKIFGWMMPKGANALKLSKMSMAGIGDKMIKGLMKKHQVPSLSESIQNALQSGVRMIACKMSMDLMGIQEEELIDGLELGGVASYLDAAEDANVNLFI